MGTATGSVSEGRWQALLNIDSFEKAAKLGAVMVAVLYVIGLLVSNEYLMYWGISDFSSFRPKCVLTGTWTVILLTGFLLPVIAPFLLIPSITFKTTQGIKQIFKTAVIGAVVGLGVDYGVLDTITHHEVGKFLWVYVLGEFLFVTGAFLFCFPLYVLVKRLSRFRPLAIFATGTMAVAGALSFVYGVAVGVYGEVPEALGGGQSVMGQLILNENGARFWKQIGGHLKPAKNATVVTASVDVLYQNDRELLLKACVTKDDGTEHRSLLILNRSLIDGFLPDEDHTRHHSYFLK